MIFSACLTMHICLWLSHTCYFPLLLTIHQSIVVKTLLYKAFGTWEFAQLLRHSWIIHERGGVVGGGGSANACIYPPPLPSVGYIPLCLPLCWRAGGRASWDLSPSLPYGPPLRSRSARVVNSPGLMRPLRPIIAGYE